MKIILSLFLFTGVCFADGGTLDDVCVFVKPDKSISIKYFVEKAKQKNETDSQFIVRENAENNKNETCIKVKKSVIPIDRKDRNKWRWDSVNKKIFVDTSVITPEDKRETLWTIAKSTANTITERFTALLEIVRGN